jgi:YHS domain-containing protein
LTVVIPGIGLCNHDSADCQNQIEGETTMRLKIATLYLTIAIVTAVMIGVPLGVQAKSQVNATFSGVAVKGYDPVAYFTEAKPVKGKAKFEYRWQGAKWRFSNAKHLALFKATPEKYAPRYGGY